MKLYPAIALIEFSSIATGVIAGDAMIKRAPISMLKAGTVSRGKYLVMIAGSTAAVEESYRAGLSVGEAAVIDKVFLPDVHPQVLDAILGARKKISSEALGLIETASIAATIAAADAGIKGAMVDIIEIRLGDALGGKAFVMMNGTVHDVTAAVTIGLKAISNEALWRNHIIIPSLHHEMARQIDRSSRFALVEYQKLAGDESEHVTG
ncbi:MAG: BMC domain-containing protein [candidate division KSB1 bacterium]|nr:BMC domain-containing protein [candidate division KSB1 bacterium]MDZ7336362.1 BMC domain-containing protein [candidate division KSB1 bacterium]MDZ7356658.1 BMC domain-containing protein [candidate division KSB1 bacterium]MDZ7376975.1 BMC domain-containing protein [candidate division KSB1 bacterium]MDZ7398535.1 BMC domain-containing protein [candidate division KSB1 bacterium]